LQIATRFWGTLDLPEEALITMTREILGFPQHRRFILLPDGTGSPFLYLQSVDDQNLAFVTLDPLLVDPEYLVPPEDVPDLGKPEDWAVLVLCTINRAERVATANLRSPLIINRVSREGGQVVLSAPYSFQHPLVPEGA
jgi:flagellar assembly factor FliW